MTRIDYLKTGQALITIGRDATMNLFYIVNPNKPGTYCWIWKDYVLVNSDQSALPIIIVK